MGLVIGNTLGILGALSGLSSVRPVTLYDPGERPPPRLPRQENQEQFPSIGQGQNNEPPVASLTGAASTPAIAVRTINDTVEEVNRTRPSLEQLSIQSQERSIRIREFFREQLQTRIDTTSEQDTQVNPSTAADTATRIAPASPTRDDAFQSFASSNLNRVESRLPASSIDARNFVQTINETAADVLVQTGRAQPAPRETGPALQINGQTVSFGNEEANRFRLNITA